jgi:hypothetical protein
MADPDERPALHALEVEVDAEIALADASTATYELSVTQWEFDPTDVQREEVGLRNLLDAVEVLEDAPSHHTGGEQ